MMLLILLYLLIGIFAGMMAGLLGIGGGLLVVPGLALVFKMQGMPADSLMHMAAGTSLAAMIPSAIAAVRAHIKRGSQIWSVYRRMNIGVIIGTIGGVLLAKVLHSRVIEILFGLMILIIAMIMIFGLKPSSHRQLPGKLPMFGMGFLIGAKSGLFGIGGGAISIPFLTYCNVPMRNAVGVSTAISLTVAVIGAISFMIVGLHAPHLPHWSTGFVYWPGVLGVAIVSPIFASLGAALSHRLPVEVLRRIFAVFLLIVGVQMLV